MMGCKFIGTSETKKKKTTDHNSSSVKAVFQYQVRKPFSATCSGHSKWPEFIRKRYYVMLSTTKKKAYSLKTDCRIKAIKLQ